MLPSPRLFRSRWTALLWAGGILWLAYDVAGSAPRDDAPANASAAAPTRHAVLTDASGAPVDDQDLHALANIIAE